MEDSQGPGQRRGGRHVGHDEHPAGGREAVLRLRPADYLKTQKTTNPLLNNFAKQLASAGPITDIGISAYHADAVNLTKYAMTKAKTTTTMQKVLKVLESIGKQNIPVGQFLAYQNPGYTATNHGLPKSAMKTYWGIIRPGTPVNGRYSGTRSPSIPLRGNPSMAGDGRSSRERTEESPQGTHL